MSTAQRRDEEDPSVSPLLRPQPIGGRFLHRSPPSPNPQDDAQEEPSQLRERATGGPSDPIIYCPNESVRNGKWGLKQQNSAVLAGPSDAPEVIANSNLGLNSRPPNGSRSHTLDRKDVDEDTKFVPPNSMPYPPILHHHLSTDPPSVPADILFSRKASPLQLTELDKYLEGMPTPPFANGVTEKGEPRKFPPMELLQNTTITELRNNRRPSPIWKDGNSIFSLLADWSLGLTGSSAVATFYSLRGIFDSVQIFALLFTTVVHMNPETTRSRWKELLLGDVPNVLALNVSALTQSVIFLMVFEVLAIILLAYFHRATNRFVNFQPRHEGLLEVPEVAKGKGWGVLLSSFVLILLYLPVSTIAVHALVWTSDFWPVPNPYLNSTNFPPPSLGPADLFRNPLDFCYTTTMRKDELNWAPLVIVVSLFTFGLVTIYFPLRLWSTTKQCLPVVDLHSELGRKRSRVELDQEYQRLLLIDLNPLNFLYNEYRRTWGTYKSIYLVIKLVALLTVAVVDPSNCWFRDISPVGVSVVRQCLLVAGTLVALAVQSVLAPFVNPVSNASEWVSRLGYVAISTVGLIVALKPQTATILDGPVVYTIYGLNYGLNGYFAMVDVPVMRQMVKQISHRLDFSFDVFSPSLDLTVSSRHVLRRIYQETLSTLLLASPECRMPRTQRMIFIEDPHIRFPVYLTEFTGTPAERHAENLKILRDVGEVAYREAVALCSGPSRLEFESIRCQIEEDFVGPDAFWDPETDDLRSFHHFGHAWWIPFPPVVVMHYDDGSTAVLTTLEQLSSFVAQNQNPSVVQRRKIRLALRALEGQRVFWSHTHAAFVGSRGWRLFGDRRYRVRSSMTYHRAEVVINRKGLASWQGVQLGSGFDLELRYARNTKFGSTIIGLDDDFDITPQLARFLLTNASIVESRTPIITEALINYRKQLAKMSQWKEDVLSYGFLHLVYAKPQDPSAIIDLISRSETDPRVISLFNARQDALDAAYRRMRWVTTNAASTWWFLLWDDVWRQNHSAITAFRTHEADFNPQFQTSVAYRPLPRPALEAFLRQRGLLGKSNGFFHPGFLNKVFVRLSEITFSGGNKLFYTHRGGRSIEVDSSLAGSTAIPNSSSRGSGAGTDHDDDEIRVRPVFRWEAEYSAIRGPIWGPLAKFRNQMGLWFGITPLEKSTIHHRGVAYDIEIRNGHFTPVDNHQD